MTSPDKFDRVFMKAMYLESDKEKHAVVQTRSDASVLICFTFGIWVVLIFYKTWLSRISLCTSLTSILESVFPLFADFFFIFGLAIIILTARCPPPLECATRGWFAKSVSLNMMRQFQFLSFYPKIVSVVGDNNPGVR